MTELFGIDIAQTVTDAMQGNLTDLTLTRETTGTYNATADRYEDEQGDPVDPTEQEFTSQGIAPAWSSTGGRLKMIENGLITASEVPILILAIPLGTDPQIDDKIDINEDTYTVTGIIGKDPAKASWTVKGKL